MKIQYLGTAAAEGWPALFCRCKACKEAARLGGKNLRTRSQAIIDDCLLVDFPPDTYLHMLRDGLDLPELSHVLITHSHQDHFYPLDLTMRGHGFSDQVKDTLHLYGNKTAEALYRETVDPIAKSWQLDRRLAFHPVEAFRPLEIGPHRVTPLTALHDRAEHCLIYLVERAGRSLLYANDTGIFPDETWDFLTGRRLDLVSLDCTTGRHKEGTNHMGLADNISVRDRLRELGGTTDGTRHVITHFSHHGELLHHELEAEAAQLGFAVAYDGMSVEF